MRRLLAVLAIVWACSCGLSHGKPLPLSVLWQVPQASAVAAPGPRTGPQFAAWWQTWKNHRAASKHLGLIASRTRCVYHGGVYLCITQLHDLHLHGQVSCWAVLLEPDGGAAVDKTGAPYANQVSCPA